MTENLWRLTIAILSGAVLFFSIWCLSNGITTIFMHLYYFPIVLLAYRYRWKGFGLATLLALAYFGLSLVFDAGQTEVILGAVYRVLVFVGIAAVIAYLSERLALETGSAQESAEIRERYISLAPAIILVLDRNGTITYLNPKGGEILKCTPGEVTGKSWFDQFLPEHDRDRVKRLFSTLVAGQIQPDQPFENPVLTRGGTEKIIRWHNTVLHDESGAITGILGFGEDITEEKQAHDTQRRLQQFQESVIANANVWISVLAPDGTTLLVWNDAAEAISGYKKSDVVGKNTVWKQLYPDKDYRRNVTGEIQRVIGKDDFLENFETEIRCADGATKIIVWNTRALRDAHGKVISYIAIGRDITDQKRLENELRDSEGRVRKKLAAILEPEGDIGSLELSDIFDQQALQALMDDFFRLTGIGVAILDNAGKILVATGWQDICTKFHLVHPETREFCHESDLTLTQGIEPGKFKLYKYKNNLWDISTPISIGGNHAGTLFLGQFFFDDETPDRELFRRHAQRYGFDEQEYLSAIDRVPRWKRDTVENVMQFYVRLIGLLSTLSYNNIRLARTLAERDTLMQSLRDSERKFHTLADWTYDWEYWIDPEQQIRYMSPSVERITGYRAEEFISDHNLVNRIVHPDDQAIWELHVPQHKKDTCGDDPVEIEIRITANDGSVRWISHICREICDDKDVPIGRRVSNRDITDKKIAEEEVRLSNVILLTQQETSPDGILIVDESGKILSFNRRFTEIWGIPPEIIDSRIHEGVLSYVMDKLSDPQEFLARVRYLYEHREEKSREEVLLKDGKVLERYSSPMLGKDNRYSGRVWYFHDITERKQAEAAIRSREEQFRVIFHNQQTGLIMVDAVTHTIADANAAALSMIGASREDVMGKVCHTFICPAEKGKCPVTDLGHTVDNSERVLIRANGEKIPILKSVNPVKIGDRPFLIESFVDLTERKQMEKQVSESRQLFADIISFLPDPTFVIDKEGKVLAWNRALEELSGVSAGDIIGKGDHEYSLWLYGKRHPILVDLVLQSDQDIGRLDYASIHWDGRTVTAQTEFIQPGSGHKTPLSLVASPLIDLQGKITGAIESMRDISRLKEAEAELSRINQNLEQIVRDRTRALEEEVAQRKRAEEDVQDALIYTRSVIEANPDLMVVLDGKGTVLDVNAAAELLIGLPREQIIGSSYFSYIVDDGTNRDTFSRLLEQGRLERIIQIRRNDGHITPLSVNAIVIGGSVGAVTRIIVAGHDITRQKQDEKAIRASLEEKVILLREVHHRVKNNLQIIISLVNLQMRQTDDPGVKQIMAETQNRVRAMSLVHEKLYRSESLSRIDFADYTRFLGTQLFSFYGTDTRRVKLDFTLGKIMVDINTAVPLGLLMNELISNALKHAFPNGREGTISISGGYEGDLIMLVVRDNGIGIPEDLDWKNTKTLGMRLITSLIDQVDGTITLDRKNGTAFTITVKRGPIIGGKE
jgi:PAS domain S-box-containing protein